MRREEGRTQTVVVQEATRSHRVTIPHEAAESLDIDPSEALLVKPDGNELRIRKAESVWDD